MTEKLSFNDNVKKEISENKKFARTCCKMSYLYGILLFSGTYKSDCFKLNIKSADVVKKLCVLADSVCGVTLSVSAGVRNFTVSAEDEDAWKLFEIMGNSSNETALRINRAVFDCDICAYAFFAGAFLSCGMISDPQKDYRLEFDISSKKRAQDLALLLEENVSKPFISMRKSSYVVYYRDSSVIEDFLNLIGAKTTIFDLMNVKIEKDMRNALTRQQNYSLANLKKTVDISVIHRQAIEKLKENGVYNKLSDDIKEIADLRIANPDASLSLLAELSKEKYGKSYINRRLRKIVELADKL